MISHPHHDLHLGREIRVNPTLERLFWVALGILAVGVLGVLGYQIRLNTLPFQAMTYTFSSLVAVHAVYMLGWKRALSFLGLTLVVSFVMEYLGVKTGLVFGAYHYTEALNPKLLGTVPVVIPFAYFMVLYPSRMMADLMVWGKAVGVTKGVAWSLTTATLAGLVMTAWDLTMDPVMVRQVKAWVWTPPGTWFGVPLRNFFGWWLTTFLITWLHEWWEPRLPLEPLGRLKKWVLALPLLGYGSLCVGGLFVGDPVDTRLVSPMAMGLPLLLALVRLSEHHQDGRAVGSQPETGSGEARFQ